MCVVCGIESNTERCRDCHEVWHFVSQLTVPERDDYVLVVDGSYSSHTSGKGSKRSGAGLVLAREYDEVVIAACSASFVASNSNQAEYEAIVRGFKWAPLNVVWSDSKEMIKYAIKMGYPVELIKQDMRDPLHNLAHRLANVGRLGEWDRLNTIWIPGEVWP